MKIGRYAVTTTTILALSIVAAFADLLPERVSGYDQLEGKIQERYGYAKDQVSRDVDDWYTTQKW